jgi:hypothetical protein
MRSMVEGERRERRAWGAPPSTTLRAVPLPLRVRRMVRAAQPIAIQTTPFGGTPSSQRKP